MKLQLKFPVTKVHINQFFGQNGNSFYAQQGLPGHNGIDFQATHGDPILATHDGLAMYQIDGNGGHGVVIVTNEQYDSDNEQAYYKTIYWHLVDSLKEPAFKSPLEGKTGFTPVKCGDIIGYADNTGLSTGDHLHFGLKPVAKGEDWGTYSNVQQNNGYFGAIDPLPFLPPYIDESLSHKFVNPILYGQTSSDVLFLQRFLRQHQNSSQLITSYYGDITAKNVLAFQIKNNVAPIEELNSLQGKRVGLKTIAKMNEIQGL